MRVSLRMASVAVLAWSGCASADDRDKPTAASPAAEVSIVAPSADLYTSARTLEVRGSAPKNVKQVRVTVNGRPYKASNKRQQYRTSIALELGANEVVVTDGTKPTASDRAAARSARVMVHRNRTAGDDTGSLDRATAWMSSYRTGAAYEMCGEGDGCFVDPVCFEVDERRVDCAVARWYTEDPIRRCQYVYTLRLRGDRLYFGFYGCQGRLNPRPDRFIQRVTTPELRRVVIDAGEHDTWSRLEVNEPNRYGTPRFSMADDRFLP